MVGLLKLGGLRWRLCLSWHSSLRYSSLLGNGRFAVAPTFLDDMATAPMVLQPCQPWPESLSGPSESRQAPSPLYGDEHSSTKVSSFSRRSADCLCLGHAFETSTYLLEDFSVDVIWRKKTGIIGYTAGNIDKKHPIRNYSIKYRFPLPNLHDFCFFWEGLQSHKPKKNISRATKQGSLYDTKPIGKSRRTLP